LRFLEMLTERFPADPRTSQALADARQDRSPEIRLAAAMASGEDGHATLAALLAAAETPEETAWRAVDALGGHLDTGLALTCLDAAVGAERYSLARALLATLAASADERAVARLATLVAGAGAELAAAAARALGDCQAAGVEAALLPGLSNELPDVRHAAAEALGKLGTAGAVAALHATVEAHSLDLALRRAAGAAIAAIQERLTGAAPGQVALVEGEAGGLALGEQTVGQVTITDSTEPATGQSPPTTHPADLERE
jgi:HEAT repeat protein